jgi:hypothetical protein
MDRSGPFRGLYAAILVAGTVLCVGAGPAGGLVVNAPGGPDLSAAALAAAATCPANTTCVVIPGTSKEKLKGGTVEATPTSDLGPNQWVYVNGYGFAATTHLLIEYCSETKPLPTRPVCTSHSTQSIAQGFVAAVTFATGTFAASLQIEEDSTSTNPITGTGTQTTQKGAYLCDAATPCSINVVDLGTGRQPAAQSPENTAVVPVRFTPSSNGCTGKQVQTVPTMSDFGMTLLVPVVARNSCANSSSPAIAANVARDGYGALQFLKTGLVDVAFTDDPQASDQQSILTQGKYKLIPVALTANVVAFHAQEAKGIDFYPVFHLDLTPTMAAGLLGGTYGTTKNTDLVKCPDASCPTPPCTPPPRTTPAPTCSLMIQLNYSQGFTAPAQYASTARSDTAGSNGLFFAWVCSAPKVPVHVKITNQTAKHKTTVTTLTATYAETITAAHELEHGFSSKDTTVTSCPTTESYPHYPTTSYGASPSQFETPNQQDLKMFGYVTVAKNDAAFGTMNWAEAHYYGLAVASLQNADGQFEAPSSTSLDAAVSPDNATVGSDGAISPNYTKAETGVYPMTSVEYAAVCADPTSAVKATAVRDMLDQMLTVTGATGSDVSQLPEGFVPLPKTIVADAQTDISDDVVGGNTTASVTASTTQTATCPLNPKTTTKAQTATTSSNSSTSANTGNASQSSTPATQTPAPQAQTSGTTTSTTSATTSSSSAPSSSQQTSGASSTPPPTTPPPSTAPSSHKKRTGSRRSGLPAFFVALASLGSRVILPLGALLAVVGLLLGGLLVLSASFRQHLASAVRGAARSVWSFATSSPRSGPASRRRKRPGSRPW